MVNLFLLETASLIQAKSNIPEHKTADYVDALCEKLAEVNWQLEQFKEILRNETMFSDPSPDNLDDLMNELTNEIQDLKVKIIDLNIELHESKGK